MSKVLSFNQGKTPQDKNRDGIVEKVKEAMRYGPEDYFDPETVEDEVHQMYCNLSHLWEILTLSSYGIRHLEDSYDVYSFSLTKDINVPHPTAFITVALSESENNPFPKTPADDERTIYTNPVLTVVGCAATPKVVPVANTLSRLIFGFVSDAAVMESNFELLDGPHDYVLRFSYCLNKQWYLTTMLLPKNFCRLTITDTAMP